MQNDQLINKLLNGYDIRHSHTLGVELYSTGLKLPVERVTVKQFEKFKRERIILLDGSDGPYDVWKHKNLVGQASGDIGTEGLDTSEDARASDTDDIAAAAQEV